MASTKVLMYSFKGGAGRTVSTVNIAYVLAAELKQRVVCIDLDIESSGSSVLFGVHDTVERGECWAVQDVLRGYAFGPRAGDRTERMRHSINLNRGDFEAALWPNLHRTIYERTDGPYLKFIPARVVLRATDDPRARDEEVVHRFERLTEKIDGINLPPDLMLYDSASGLQDTAMAGLLHCHAVVLFMRWSRQFVFGTIRFLQETICQRKFCPRVKRIIVVPTAVPLATPEGDLGRKLRDRRRDLEAVLKEVNKRAVEDFGAPPDWVRLAEPIRECADLKWDDRIFLNERRRAEPEVEGVLNDYRGLARVLIETSQSTRG